MSDVFLIESSTNPTHISVGEEIAAEEEAAVAPPKRKFDAVPPALTKRVSVTRRRVRLRWDVLESVRMALQPTWDVFGPTTVSKSFGWNVVAEVGVNIVQKWDVLETVAKSAEFEWPAEIPVAVAAEEELAVMIGAW